MKILDRIAAAISPAINVVGLGGEGGGQLLDDTDPREGEFKAIVPLEEIEIDTVKGNIANLDGKTFPAGIPIHGLFTFVQLTSGRVLLYNC